MSAQENKVGYRVYRIWTYFLVITMALIFVVPSNAEIVVTVYSHDLDDSYPHAFIVVEGVDAQGTTVDENIGFTARKISPAILVGSVKGKVSTVSEKYILKSDRQFSLKISDQEYVKLIALKVKWQNIPGKSYNLKKRNCVHFIGEALTLLGFKTNLKSKYFKKPKGYLKEVKSLNPNFLQVDSEARTIEEGKLPEMDNNEPQSD